jgi:branched-chain amino acid transport system substrate-binding protein
MRVPVPEIATQRKVADDQMARTSATQNGWRVLAPRIFTALALVLCTTGCPSQKRSVLGTVPPVPETGNPSARARFAELSSRFEKTGANVTPDMESLASEYPQDPVAAYALLYAGMSAVHVGDYQRAVLDLHAIEKHRPEASLRARADLYLGIAQNYLGKYPEALAALRAAENALNTDDKEERAEWEAAMAEANSQTGRAVEAVGHYDAWYHVGRASERTYALSRIRALAAGLDEASAASAYSQLSSRNGPAAAVLGARLAADATARGDNARAQALRAETEDARKEIGLVPETTARDGGDPARLGAILPLSGRQNRVGDRSMRGLAMATGASRGRAAFQVAVRDSQSTAGTAAAAVEQLTAENVIAVIGPMEVEGVNRAGERAGRLGVPMLSLSPRAESHANGESRFLFHTVHSAEQRARALARYAVANKVKDFAVLAPDNAYGKTVGGAFASEVERLGGHVLATANYAAKATAFTDAVKKLRKPWRAIFIPDQARRLALVAPALAAGNYVARPLDAKVKGGGRRAILLLSTAELVDDRFLTSAGRYCDGAVLAPGFYPDRKDELIGRFVDEYYAAFGGLPTALEAYAYDAALAIGAAIASGARSRSELAARLASVRVRGLTGEIQFDAVRMRADDGLLYRVEQLPSHDFELRALR